MPTSSSADSGPAPSTSPSNTPIPSPSAGAWRLEVGRFRASCPQRTFPLGVHVGAPAGSRRSFAVPWPVPEDHDEGLRFDLVVALLSAHPNGPRPVSVWLTRPGVPSLHDQDVLWHATATRACAAAGQGLERFCVVTKSGWLDVRTGESRTWARLRL